MAKEIDLTTSITKLIKDDPQILEMITGIGTSKTTKSKPSKLATSSILLQLVGRFINLKSGAKIMGIPVETVVEELTKLGYKAK